MEKNCIDNIDNKEIEEGGKCNVIPREDICIMQFINMTLWRGKPKPFQKYYTNIVFRTNIKSQINCQVIFKLNLNFERAYWGLFESR